MRFKKISLQQQNLKGPTYYKVMCAIKCFPVCFFSHLSKLVGISNQFIDTH